MLDLERNIIQGPSFVSIRFGSKHFSQSGIADHDGPCRTALTLAGANGTLSAVKLLIERYKVSVQDTGRDRRNVFHTATLGGKTDTMMYLGYNFPELINARDDRNETALTLASEFGSLQVVRLLIERLEVNVQETGSYGRNAFLKGGVGKRRLVELSLRHEICYVKPAE